MIKLRTEHKTSEIVEMIQSQGCRFGPEASRQTLGFHQYHRGLFPNMFRGTNLRPRNPKARRPFWKPTRILHVQKHLVYSGR